MDYTPKYFKEKEFQACSPACSMSDMHPETLRRMDALREAAGIPCVLNSAGRTYEWERSKGRPGTSSHVYKKDGSMKCRAVDIRCNNNANRMKLIKAAIEVGYRRIGVANTFIHVDDDPAKSQDVVWMY